MVRNLAAQIEAIWPQEQPIFARHPPPSRILDVGCGIGESIFKLAQLYPKAAFTGVDLEESHLERACAKNAHLGDRARFQREDALKLSFRDAQFDLAISRHVLQATPDVLSRRWSACSSPAAGCTRSPRTTACSGAIPPSYSTWLRVDGVRNELSAPTMGHKDTMSFAGVRPPRSPRYRRTDHGARELLSGRLS